WKALLLRSVKLNVDAASGAEDMVGLSFVIQDHHGAVLAHGGKRLHMEGQSSTMETLAARFT
ncbi:hypothetical protein Ancab_024943, partial [Ancistrocladus abbreviatus]